MTFGFENDTSLLIWSALTGAALSIVYDVFRLIRAFGIRDVFTTFVSDVVFCILYAVSYVLLLFNFTNGNIRLYAFLTLTAGFLLCHFTLGVLIMRCADRVLRFLRLVTDKIKKGFIKLFIKLKNKITERKNKNGEKKRQ